MCPNCKSMEVVEETIVKLKPSSSTKKIFDELANKYCKWVESLYIDCKLNGIPPKLEDIKDTLPSNMKICIVEDIKKIYRKEMDLFSRKYFKVGYKYPNNALTKDNLMIYLPKNDREHVKINSRIQTTDKLPAHRKIKELKISKDKDGNWTCLVIEKR